MRRSFISVSLLTLGAMLLAVGAAGTRRLQPLPPAGPPAAQLGALSLAFEPNAGQTDPSVRFLARGAGGTWFFTADGVVLKREAGQEAGRGLQSEKYALADPPSAHTAAPAPPAGMRLRFLGAQAGPLVPDGTALPGRVNYFQGNDRARWQTGLPTYAGIRYERLYPGIDLAYTGAGGRLKSTYTVAPGADPSQIHWRYECGDTGTPCQVAVDAAGNLQIRLTTEQTLTEQAPLAWQEIAGQQAPVAVRYALGADGSVGFALGAYDPARPLVLDPTLTYSSYLGGSGDEEGLDMTRDAAGNIYVTGFTSSLNFPLAGSPYQPTLAGVRDAFVAKFNPSGSALLYATYLGGNDDDEGFSIVVDDAGSIYVTGKTASPNFPLQNPLQAAYGGLFDVFITKLTPTGNALIYSTYLGGASNDQGIDMVVDPRGILYIVGDTGSPTFPVVNPYQGTLNGNSDAYVIRLNQAGSALLYSTFLGGSGQEGGYGLAVNTAGNIFLTGITRSADFPVVNALQPTYGGPSGDVYVTEFNVTGSALVYSTYLGGNGEDYAFGIAIDGADNAYVTGPTHSSNFPLHNPIQPTWHGDYDVFVSKITTGGAGLAYSTYLGGCCGDYAADVAVDATGSATVIGWTSSSDFPVVNAIQPVYGQVLDAFVTRVNPAGSAWVYSTFLGGAASDAGEVVILDGVDSAYIVGTTASTNFPVVNPYQATNGGLRDAFIAKITDAALSPTATFTPSPTPSPTPTSTAIIPTATRTPTATFTPTPCTIQFTDVDLNNPFYPYIRCLACHQIISGYADGTFRPNNDVTRAQVSKMVANAAGFTDAIQSTQQSFTDLPTSAPFWLYVERLARRGYINGYQCGGPGEPCDPAQRPYFRPNNAVMRGQLAKIDAQAAGYADPIPTTQQTFVDVPYGSPFWLWVEQVALHGVISGYQCGGPGELCDPALRPYFRPYNTATRGQTSKIVANTFFPIGCLPSRAPAKGSTR